MARPQWQQTKDGSITLIHPEHGQSYHSLAGAWNESQTVFLKPALQYAASQNLKELAVLDVGFGLGLNWLAFVDWALQESQLLTIHSLENEASLLQLDLPPNNVRFVSQASFELWEDLRLYKKIKRGFVDAVLHLQDAKKTLVALAKTNQKFHIVLQDPFSVQINPTLWDEEYFLLLKKVCAPNAFLTTYAAASLVQKNLKKSGFEIFKVEGFAGKRERIQALLKSS